MNNLRRDLVDLTTQRTARLEAAQAALDAVVRLRCCVPSSFRRLPASGSKTSSSWLPAL